MTFFKTAACRNAALLAVSTALIAGCSSEGIAGRDPIKPEFYSLLFVDNGTPPGDLVNLMGGKVQLVAATLVPYAVGRPGNNRLVNDRTGGGTTGGNTRDTTVQRGQMMDLRIFRFKNSNGTNTDVRDSTVVDVELQDTLFIVSRPHPDPKRTVVDTGRFVESLLVVWTAIDLSRIGVTVMARKQLSYKITR